MKSKIKVAVIDTGVARNYLANGIYIQKYVAIKQRVCENSGYGFIEITEKVYPQNGENPSHGTKVINTIKKYAINVPIEFQVYDVFDENGKSSGVVIIEAIKRILEDNIDFIVMSLTCSSKYKEDFKDLEAAIRQKKVLFICAASNDGGDNCPADLEFAYGVSGDAIGVNGIYRYSVVSKIQFWSDVQWEFVGEEEQVHLFCGTSKATAVIAGRLISYMYNHGKDNLFAYLSYNHDEITKKQKEKTKTLSIDKYLLQTYCRVFGLEKEFCIEKLDTYIPWHSRNISKFIVFMEEIGLKEHICLLNYSEFSTLRNILRTCQDKLERLV